MRPATDFTQCTIDHSKMYGGQNGSKIGIVYNNEIYMLKFPTLSKKNKLMHYTNGCISEDIACQIFSSLGIPTQKTILGTYKDKIVVACKDFTTPGTILQDFASLKNTVVESKNNGYGTELSDILNTIDEQQIVPPKKLKEHFWNMFIADTLLGNFDRHNGNWGFLNNTLTGKIQIAPVYDCGSCLYPQLTETQMQHIINTPSEIEQRLFVFPTSAIKENDIKIHYADFLLTTDNPDCIHALKTINTHINLQKINQIINDTPYISNTHKQFLSTMIKERHNKIIQPAVAQLEQTKNIQTNRGADAEARFAHILHPDDQPDDDYQK